VHPFNFRSLFLPLFFLCVLKGYSTLREGIRVLKGYSTLREGIRVLCG